MDNKQISKLGDLTLDLYFDLAVLNSAIKISEDLEVCVLENFIERNEHIKYILIKRAKNKNLFLARLYV